MQRDGTALIMAALREDHDAMARLLVGSSAEDLLRLTVFCAQFAATTCREQQRQSPGRDMHAALRTVALQLAAKNAAC